MCRCSGGDSGAQVKLWILSPVDYLDRETSPWEPWYDKAFGFVVRAENEAEARALASSNGGREVSEDNNPRSWLDPELSTCTELTQHGPSAVIIRDFASS